jgi:hypothetical protein
VALGTASHKDPLGERLYSVSLWAGVVTWQTVILLVGCLVALRKCEQSSSALACPGLREGPAAAA